MKPESQEVANQIIQRVAENPKLGMAVGGVTAGWSFTANDVALYLGIAVAAVSLYNQLMVAIRSRKKKDD